MHSHSWSPLHRDQPLEGASRSSALTLTIVAGYVAVFWVALPALLWALGTRLDRWLSLPAPGAFGRTIGFSLFAIASLALVGAMDGLRRDGRGLPISHLPPRQLVTRGAYTRLRHPIYVAFTTGFGGLALALGSLGASLGSGAVLALAATAYARIVEEPRLAQRFGGAYHDYARRAGLVTLVPPRAAALVLASWRCVSPAAQRLANHTVAWRGRRVSLVTYGVFVGVGAAAMVLWAGAQLVTLGVSPRRFCVFSVVACVAMLVGGRVAGLGYRLRLLLERPVEALRTVGFVSWGGYAALLCAALALAPFLGVSMGLLADRLLLPGLLCSSIGRLGCLSYGCCGGRPWPHGITWYAPDARIVRELGADAVVPRVPTQLLSSASTLALLGVLLGMTTRSLPAGALTALAALLYGLVRVLVEHTREEHRLLGSRFTRGQAAALATSAVGTLALFVVDGPASWPVPAWSASATAWCAACPAAIVAGTLALLVTGLHGRRVGRW